MDGAPARSHAPAARRFVLLDRDGTINVDRHYLAEPDQLELLPGAAAGLRAMRLMGLGLVVVTNQSGIGRGYFGENAVSAVNTRLRELLLEHRVTIDGIYVCGDAPGTGSTRRKPRPGLVLEAARDFGFDPRAAFVVGDKPSDVGLGRNVGATTILVRTGYGPETEHDPTCRPDFVVDDLAAAARVVHGIISRPRQRAKSA